MPPKIRYSKRASNARVARHHAWYTTYPKSKGNMKKTTKRGAYKKNKKRVMVNRRAPMVETKSRTHEDVRYDFSALPDRQTLTTYDTPHLALNPNSFLAMTQGLREDQIIGRSVFSKYLNMKIKIRFPQHAFTLDSVNKIIPVFPQNYELIWGWIPFPMGCTGNTTPHANLVTVADVHSHINLRLVDYFDSQKDFLRFIPKKASTIRITGSRKVRPDLRRYSTAPASMSEDDNAYLGSIPDYETNIKWKTMKKIHYEPSQSLESTGAGKPGLYPNYQWLPFCVLVNWDYDIINTMFPTDEAKRKLYQPAVAWNDIHYFTDS